VQACPDKVLLAALLKKVAPVSNRWLGERLMPAAASMARVSSARFAIRDLTPFA